MEAIARLAPAKVNLFLHVGPLEADGYHPLASLVVFADVGDRLTVEAADGLSLAVTGPFADALQAEDDNLVLKAVRALGAAAGIGEPGLRITLDKQLPVAAGLGGGSSDAGAVLKLARDALGLPFDDAALAEIAAALAADGPMCLHARAAWAEGRGDVLTFEAGLLALPALLVNPGVPSSTGAVYRAFDAGSPGEARRPAPPSDWDAASVIDWLAIQRNDLEAPAAALAPAIGEALAATADLPGARLTRMSGSGATVFALFDTARAAEVAGRALAALHPDWWVRPTVLR
ncbi:4-diphosphocytidyl-2-C-methyl-D-erythritol kinase [Brevundimonas denitrificans]|uniref:4-diphosphocytidyl-2-C-methyl-D-erythritol kinase n=1 Tax=Brevundimonas denitrificans TaxID=1443434 RepID=A0ABQ6BJS6_9CAUL|nr:4-(cytidine 5'-diphospho)-2-C-methyl-D-erythritol kinase [Brevundimonas denitrificans]GLS00746.1 4-diphosphocytidyl-2-C-methyl-D-erythritol kinase [Brevundimonas denitrificans]